MPSESTLSNQLKSVQSHFKIRSKSTKVENAIIDLDFGYSFSHRSIFKEIPAGVYHVGFTRSDDFILAKASKKTIVNTNDDLQDLIDALTEFEEESSYDSKLLKEKLIHQKSTGFLSVGYFPLHRYNLGLKASYEDLVSFLRSKNFYEKNELGFKRSQLLFGTHGCGKSKYIDWLSKELIKELDAIVLRINNAGDIERILNDGILMLNNLTKTRLVIFVIEELSQIVRHANGHIAILHLLDNNLLRDNVIFLSTTNSPEKIQSNVIGRFQRLDQLIEVSSSDNGDRFIDEFYKFVFKEELPSKYRISKWYSDELTPAALKELFVYSIMRQVDLNESYIKILEREKLVKDKFDHSEPIGFNFL